MCAQTSSKVQQRKHWNNATSPFSTEGTQTDTQSTLSTCPAYVVPPEVWRSVFFAVLLLLLLFVSRASGEKHPEAPHILYSTHCFLSTLFFRVFLLSGCPRCHLCAYSGSSSGKGVQPDAERGSPYDRTVLVTARSDFDLTLCFFRDYLCDLPLGEMGTTEENPDVYVNAIVLDTVMR